MNIKSIEQIMAPWTAEHQKAAQREGWALAECESTEGTKCTPVQVEALYGRAVPPGAYPLRSVNEARMIVRTGTGEHHSVARRIIHDHFPAEWALLEAAAAGVRP